MKFDCNARKVSKYTDYLNLFTTKKLTFIDVII
jgi:hypothetical protein